jgi:hypothetical protein
MVLMLTICLNYFNPIIKNLIELIKFYHVNIY